MYLKVAEIDKQEVPYFQQLKLLIKLKELTYNIHVGLWISTV